VILKINSGLNSHLFYCYYITDHLGSTRAVVDDGGNVLETFDYYPFGLLMPKRNTAGANTIEKFTGKERDTEGNLNLDYFGARYYDPALGRWTSVDPKADKYPEWSPYTYTLDNPINLFDPDGKDPFKITVRTFIPYASVLGFKGDNRSFSRSDNASYRTSHTVGVETNPTVSRNPLISDNKGKTGLTSTSFGVLPLPGGGSLPLFGKAPEGKAGGFSAIVSRSDANKGDNAVITFTGSAKNPVTNALGFGIIPTPAIDYNFTVSITPGKDGADPTIGVTGSHDGFPAFEINVTDEKTGTVYQVYSKGPDSKIDIRKLVPPDDDVKVNQ
jgi:RHS repeat-associated protein